MTSAPGRGAAGGWLAGLTLGALTGLTTISFALGILGIPILLASVALIAWKGPRLLGFSGFATGWGLIWSAVIIQATVSCLTFERGPDRYCEPGDVGPFLMVGVVVFVLGLAGSAFALRRIARRP